MLAQGYFDTRVAMYEHIIRRMYTTMDQILHLTFTWTVDYEQYVERKATRADDDSDSDDGSEADSGDEAGAAKDRTTVRMEIQPTASPGRKRKLAEALRSSRPSLAEGSAVKRRKQATKADMGTDVGAVREEPPTPGSGREALAACNIKSPGGAVGGSKSKSLNLADVAWS